MKNFTLFVVLIGMILSACKEIKEESLPTVCAHRGCWIKNLIPENSTDGIAMAKRFGYPAVEIDVKYTSDSMMVVMHDRTINRTMRCAADYTEIKEPVMVTETSFAELREKYVLASDEVSYRKPIPTLQEMLEACRENGVTPMLHSRLPESYELAQQIMGDNWVCFNESDACSKAGRALGNELVLLNIDPSKEKVAEVVERLKAVGGRCGVSTMNHKFLTKEYIDTLRINGFEVQSSIFPSPHEAEAFYNGATIVLSDFCWLPMAGQKPTQKWVKKVNIMAEYAPTGLDPMNALTVSLKFCGTVKLKLNDNYEYILNHETPRTITLGWRTVGSNPKLKIEALEETSVKVVANVYQL